MSDMPENFWAIHVHIDDATWYECPVKDAEKYIRADIHEAKIKDLQEEVRDLGTWFDRRKLAHKAIDEEVINAAKGYLRVCRSGGMDPDESSLVLSVIEEMARLSVFADMFSRAQSNNDAKRIKELEYHISLTPDEIDIYRIIKLSGARKHSDIAKAIAKVLHPKPPKGASQ